MSQDLLSEIKIYNGKVSKDDSLKKEIIKLKKKK